MRTFNITLLSIMLSALTVVSVHAVEDATTVILVDAKPPVDGTAWGTGYDRYDYLKPCGDKTAYVAIVVQGVNRRDVLEKNATGQLSYYADVAIGYSTMAKQCAMVIAPKSGLVTTFNDDNVPVQWRTWWHTDGVNGGDGIPVRDGAEEMEALIQIIHDVRDTLEGLPVHLVIGNDYGKFMAKIMEELSVMRQSDAINGFIHVNRHDGRLTEYERGS